MDDNERAPKKFDDVFGEGAEAESTRRATDIAMGNAADVMMDSLFTKDSPYLTPAENQERLRLLRKIYRPHPKGGYSQEILEPEEQKRLHHLNRKAGL